LVHQSRLAAMGEMVGNIAHQWRQPLNALAMVLANLQDARRYHDLTEETFTASLTQGNALVQQMSMTITDFMDFFRPAKAALPFSLNQQAQAAIELVAPSLHHHRVSVEVLEGPEVWAMGHPSEFSQVLLNLIGNARDAIRASGDDEGFIRIAIFSDEADALVRVTDNGGGIKVTPIQRIFEPYFTDKATGTGLGLYMSRMILEQGMRGTIEARNIPGGAEFSISIPLAESSHDLN
jgi:signal transduction histidine kinase